MMIYEVWHRTHYRNEKLHGGLSLEEATYRVDELVAMNSTKSSRGLDGLGQSIEIKKYDGVPYSVQIQTMTAEAGWVLDAFSVECVK